MGVYIYIYKPSAPMIGYQPILYQENHVTSSNSRNGSNDKPADGQKGYLCRE